jgi:DNA repair photolyase
LANNNIRLIAKKSSTFHDFPYSHRQRKCFHCWIINVTPPGPNHCRHQCLYCYAREAIYSNYSEDTLIYNNLPELVEKDLKKLSLCPPVSISNISDPCQDIPELKSEVKRLVQLLMNYGISFAITTKGDPSFLLEIPGFAEYEPKLIATTIEGTPEILQLLSPQAPPFYARLVSVNKLSRLGARTVVRLDPVFIHLFQALYGESWFCKMADLIDTFGASGARHIISSTGRLSKKPGRGAFSQGKSSWQRVHDVIYACSPLAAKKFQEEYRHESSWAGMGYMLRRDLRLDFHRKVRALVEAQGMTYATCQELPARDSDSHGLPHCEGMPLPFARRGMGGTFYPIPHCTANCHVSCRDLPNPSCERPDLVTPQPLKISRLR